MMAGMNLRAFSIFLEHHSQKYFRWMQTKKTTALRFTVARGEAFSGVYIKISTRFITAPAPAVSLQRRVISSIRTPRLPARCYRQRRRELRRLKKGWIYSKIHAWRHILWQRVRLYSLAGPLRWLFGDFALVYKRKLLKIPTVILAFDGNLTRKN